MRSFTVGDRFVHERTFSIDEVRTFVAISQDAGAHHERPGVDGRLLVHGLLTATIPTKLGGDLNYLAREMHFEFLLPVYTGESIRCELVVTDVDERDDRTRLAFVGTCTNERGEDVLRFRSRGVIRRS